MILIERKHLNPYSTEIESLLSFFSFAIYLHVKQDLLSEYSVLDNGRYNFHLKFVGDCRYQHKHANGDMTYTIIDHLPVKSVIKPNQRVDIIRFPTFVKVIAHTYFKYMYVTKHW